jgi:hypothetical protein
MNAQPQARRRAIAGAALLGLLAAALVIPAPALAQGGGRIDGIVVHGGDEAPVADVGVRLTRLEDEVETELAATRTDAEGRFSFDGVAGPHHEVVTTYDGAAYRSGLLTIAEGETTDVDLEVFDSTDADDDVVISSWVVWVDRTDGVAIQQDLQVENRGERTYLGEQPDEDGLRAVITVPLAPGASGLRFLGRFTECCATMRGTDYVHTAPLVPGTTFGTLRYHLESLDDGLTLRARFPVESFTMMVPAGVTVGTSELALSGELESQGNTYAVYTAEELDRGEVLQLSFRGLTTPGTVWPVAAGAVVLLLAAAAGGWWWPRRRRAGPPAVAAAAPLAEERRSPASTAVTADALIEEIALLDEGFERGLLTREVYEPLRAARKAELLERSARTGG